jgi:hypothetical protein
MRIVRRDARLFLGVSAQLLADGFGVRFRAGGASMQPAIHDGDALIVAPVSTREVRPGDVLLYRRDRRGIAHRVVRVRTTGGAVMDVLLRGDAEPACDAPVAAHDVLGRLVAVDRTARQRWPSRLSAVVRRTARWLLAGDRSGRHTRGARSVISRTKV